MKRLLIYPIIISFCFFSCTHQQYAVTSIQGERQIIKANDNEDPNKEITKLVSEYKHLLDNEMNQVIGRSDQEMTYGRPESLLTNLTSDVILDYVKSVRKTDCDLSFMNVNGHRSDLAKGDITIGDIFEIYPFENSLTVLKLKGSDLLEAFNSYAKLGGAGISSTVRLTIKDKQLIDSKVNGLPVDKNKVYTIVTLDYLADGNDGMEVLKNAIETEPFGIILRDVMLDYIHQATKQGKGITSQLDGRITIEK